MQRASVWQATFGARRFWASRAMQEEKVRAQPGVPAFAHPGLHHTDKGVGFFPIQSVAA